MQVGELENRFVHHAPNDDSGPRYMRLRHEFLRLALMIDALAPDSREKSLAVTSLEEAMMWANSAIARNPGLLPPLDVFERRFHETLVPLTKEEHDRRMEDVATEIINRGFSLGPESGDPSG